MKANRTPLAVLFGYATGGGVFSITINGIAAYAMLYYTQVVGLSARSVGFALSLSAVWDAVAAPMMGHWTDRCRSRFGARHPFILLGGIGVAFSYFFLWCVPGFVSDSNRIFWYILVVNFAVRSAETIFFVPYVALGFEISTDYEERSKLQGIYYFMLQIVNFVCVAVGWSLFFHDGTGADGSRIDGTKIASNYSRMGWALCGVTVLLTLVCVFSTRKYAKDNRAQILRTHEKHSLFGDVVAIAKDRNARLVFLFYGVATLAMMIVSQIQMFTYVDYMNFTPGEKTFVHGGGMISFALGSILQVPVLRRIDKKPAVYLGMLLSAIGSIALLFVFTGGLVPIQAHWLTPTDWPLLGGKSVPIAACVFLLFQGMWWGGIGMLVACITSMVADISEVNLLRSGILKDGSYSAMFGFVTKASCALGLLLTGWLLERSGFVSGSGAQTAAAVNKVAILTFVLGPAILAAALPFLWKYPIDRKFMSDIKARLEAHKASQPSIANI